MMRFKCRRIFLLAGLHFFILPLLVFSSSSTPLADLKIPSQIGSIKEVFESEQFSNSKVPTIIQIQDAHCNYEAQKNLASILEYLIKEKNVKLVMVEGGSGDVTLSFLRSYAEKKDRELIADKYLKDGKISGEEYLDIVSDYNFELYGIEDPALYERNLDTFLNIEDFRGDALKDCAILRKIVAALEPQIYNSELRNFAQAQAKYENKETVLAEYCAYIKEKALSKRLDLEKYPQFEAFFQSVELEKEINFKNAEAQRSLFIKDLAGKLAEDEVKKLIARTQDFKAQKITNVEYYGFLRSAAEGRIDLKQTYPQLDSYILYTELAAAVKSETLIHELALLEKEIKDSLLANDDEKELSRISTDLGMLESFFKLNLTPKEYEEFISRKNQINTASWVNFLSENCLKYGIGAKPEISASIDQNIEKFNNFYRIGLEREQSFLKNIADKLSISRDEVAVVITGGFHTPGMSKLFKEHGYSYAVVMPAITQKADPAVYYSVLRGDRGEIEDTYLAED